MLSACLGGASSQENAEHFGSSVRTVEVHRLRANVKLGARSAVHLGYLLASAGFSPPEWTKALLPPDRQEDAELQAPQQIENQPA